MLASAESQHSQMIRFQRFFIAEITQQDARQFITLFRWLVCPANCFVIRVWYFIEREVNRYWPLNE